MPWESAPDFRKGFYAQDTFRFGHVRRGYRAGLRAKSLWSRRPNCTRTAAAANGGYTTYTADGNPAAAALTAAPCATCQPQQTCCWKVHGWLGADYLMMFPQSQPGPAIIATGGAAAPVVVAGGRTSYGLSSGFRIEAGLWLNSEDSMGTQTIYDQLFRRTVTTAPAGAVTLVPTVGGALGAAFGARAPSRP